jgi:hypothetical protein
LQVRAASDLKALAKLYCAFLASFGSRHCLAGDIITVKRTTSLEDSSFFWLFSLQQCSCCAGACCQWFEGPSQAHPSNTVLVRQAVVTVSKGKLSSNLLATPFLHLL